MFRAAMMLMVNAPVAAAGPWAFVAAGAIGTGVNPVAAVPAGIASGDLLVIVGATRDVSFSDPGGWTVRLASAASATRLGVWSKTAGSSESDVTLTNSASASKVVMVAYRNISALDVNGTKSSDDATTGSLSTNSLTTTVADDLVISIYGVRSSTATRNWTTIPSGTNTRVNSGAPSGATAAGILIVDENKSAAGATTARTASVTAGGTVGMDAFAISFKQT